MFTETTGFQAAFIKDFLSKSEGPVFEGYVSEFYVTVELYNMVKRWVDEALEISENKKGLIQARIGLYSAEVDLTTHWPECQRVVREKFKIRSEDFRKSYGLGLSEDENEEEFSTCKVVDYIFKPFETGYKHYLQGQNKIVQELYENLAVNAKTDADKYSLKHFQLDQLFNYCNGYARAKFVTYLTECLNEIESTGLSSILLKDRKNACDSIEAPTVSLFCQIVHHLELEIMLDSDTKPSYCKRVCEKYQIYYPPNTRKSFNNSEPDIKKSDKHLQEVINIILPKLSSTEQDKITKYIKSKTEIMSM
jgi:hypothetical protein